MVVNVLYAVDCNEYKLQYNKYINKAKANKSLSKRYNLVAERYNIMFLNCKSSNKQPLTKSSASSYRTNPFNTK